MFDDVYLRNNN